MGDSRTAWWRPLALWGMCALFACGQAEEGGQELPAEALDPVMQAGNGQSGVMPGNVTTPMGGGAAAGSSGGGPTGTAFGDDGDGQTPAGGSGQTAGGAGNGGGAVAPTVVPPTPDKAEPCSVTGCPTGLVCDAAGFCATPPPACLADSDCGMGQRCGLTGDCLDPGACVVDQDCAMAETCREMACTLGSDCGQTELKIDPLIPNVLVLLDISQSMAAPPQAGCIDPNVCLAKIRIAEQAMGQMTATYRDKINWGLAMFAGDAQCAPPDPMGVITPGPGNEDMVVSYISQVVAPVSRTPINASIAAIQASSYLGDPDARNYLLFISDGAESCMGDNNDTRQRIADMQAAGIGTFVVGFGDGVDVNWLNQFSDAGGHANPNGTQDPLTMLTRTFYAADDAAGLEMALGSILGSVIGCDFALAEPPEDPEAVWAFLDDVMVDRDTPDGWVLDETNNQVSFMGSSCARLQSGEVRDIDIVFGCPEPVLE